MIKFINECVGCPPERGCLGESCPNRNVADLICDECGCEPDELYVYGNEHLCVDCLKECLDVINYDNYTDYI